MAWYNGLPEAVNFQPKLNAETVAIIGQGNVAIDVARILLASIDELRKTDITKHALDTLAESKVKNVYLVGRRGPLQAAFTIAELREMTKLPEVGISWRSEDFLGISDELSNLPRPRKRITELMLKSLSEQAQKLGTRRLLPIFLRSPKLIEANNNLLLSVNQLCGTNAVATDSTELLECNLVLRSIGYKSVSLDEELNFNEAKGFVNNHDGKPP